MKNSEQVAREQVVRIKFGSHLYGTNTPTSDVDYKSVYTPDANEILLQRVVGSLQIGGKVKREGEKNLPEDVDNECFSLQRYLGLVAEGQTVAVDMLFAPEPELATDLWRRIQANKDRLLTKKSAAFVGYCRTQANKYGIKGSRVAAAKSALERFERLLVTNGPLAKVGDFFSDADEVIDEHTRTLRKETTKGRTERYFECCNRMVGFTNTLKEAVAIYRRIHENYGDRAQLAEKNEGIDWKALSHAVRVGLEAAELLNTHHVTFPLPYAPHILQIKQGLVPYDLVAQEIETLLESVERAAEASTLRDEPDYQFIDELVAEVYGKRIVSEQAALSSRPERISASDFYDEHKDDPRWDNEHAWYNTEVFAFAELYAASCDPPVGTALDPAKVNPSQVAPDERESREGQVDQRASAPESGASPMKEQK
jgi:hypothetical protein